MKKILVFSIILATMSCSQNYVVTNESTIDNTMQSQVENVLRENLNEFGAMSGQAIIVESATGAIKAAVGLERADSLGEFQDMDVFNIPQYSGLIKTAALLAMLESGKVRLGDVVDTGNGILTLEEDEQVRDNNYYKGGYGEDSVLHGFACYSDVAHVLSLKRAFADGGDYFTLLGEMSVNEPDSVEGLRNIDLEEVLHVDCDFVHAALGFHKVSPIQNVAFYNAIANGGRMVKPHVCANDTLTINPQIASKEGIDSLKAALRYVVTDGFGRSASADGVAVAGYLGNVQLPDYSYIVEFCGYAPADRPKYTILVSIQKADLPASSKMAGKVFKEIVGLLNME